MYNMGFFIHHQFSFITKSDDVVGVAHSSSDDSLESEDDEKDECSPCSSESSTGLEEVFFLGSAGVAGEDLGWSIWTN